ncbi:hypothetical protein EQG49_03930 [Periweissella cryptocerci]|uniref:Uncharacterized protein n=1 Tax=Periweissella cryptocerci TaxID=2506420 RepID=A0A4P6YSM1_9LACO|nr:hypothetical protein [Periweissella cryptocerci]QBO35666.1 hypothetical protein EQG49_03930 [Periweissella cryptocerci]
MLKNNLLLGGTLISFFIMLVEIMLVALLNILTPLVFEVKVIDTDQTFQFWATSLGGVTILTIVIFVAFVVLDILAIKSTHK